MEKFIGEVRNLYRNSSRIYIYGAGLYAKNVYKIISEHNFDIEGFVTTTEKGSFCGKPVLLFADIEKENTGLIIGANRKNSNDIRSVLINSKFPMKSVVWGSEFIDHGNERGGLNGRPAVEFTTKIGCSVDCRYCPQDILLKQYFKENTSRQHIMDMEVFRTCVNKLPQECGVIFGGMSEPFLNEKCVEMVKEACETGRHVELQTTLVGLDKKKLNELFELPIAGVMLHVADKFGYAKIPMTDEYLEMLKLVINRKKEDGGNWITFCNAQAEPPGEIVRLASQKYSVLTSLLDRAGNLECEEELIHKENLTGKIKCSLCSEKLNRNILLPDGTLLLCCMDYGMKHVLGNLRDETYENLLDHGKEINLVKCGMNGDEKIDILCRKCSCASACEN